MLSDADKVALERVRAVSIAPSTVAATDDLRLLVAAVDRLAGMPDLPTVAAALRTLIAQMDAGQVKDQVAIRQRLTGAMIAVELLAAGDDMDAVAARLMDTARP